MLKKIPGNAEEDSGECWRGFRGMLKKIPGNVPEDSGECSRRFREMLKGMQWECTRIFRGMFEKILGNVQEDSGESKFRFILWNLAYFLTNSVIKLRQNKGMFSMLLLTTYN